MKTGEVYGHLTVLEILIPDSGRKEALCVCDCGKTTIVRPNDLKSGHTKSCGCLKGSHLREKNKIVNKGEYSEIITSRGEVILVDSEDVNRLAPFTWRVKKVRPYAQIDGESVLMHRFLLNFPDSMIDHKNRDPLDNRKKNLRLATASENKANSITRKGYKGVDKHGGKWYARITKNGQRRHLGTFNSPIEAAMAYDSAARLLFGEFARTNFRGGKNERL